MGLQKVGANRKEIKKVIEMALGEKISTKEFEEAMFELKSIGYATEDKKGNIFLTTAAMYDLGIEVAPN